MTGRSEEYERLSTTPADFIAQHQVFRVEEFVAAYRGMKRKASGARATLAYHVNQGRLYVVKRGVYGHVSRIDEWLLASKLTPDAVVSHDGALSIRALIPVGFSLTFLTAHRAAPLSYEDLLFRPLRLRPEFIDHHIETVRRFGQAIRVTTLDRTLVDCLQHLDHAPPPEELLSVFLATEHETSASTMLRWALTYESPLLVSRLFFFLRCGKRELSPDLMKDFFTHSLKIPDYFQRSERKLGEGIIIRSCNLIVPRELARRWPHNR